ncbi:MAG: hypothetical protein ACI33J_07635 [Clostridium sp.]
MKKRQLNKKILKLKDKVLNPFMKNKKSSQKTIVINKDLEKNDIKQEEVAKEQENISNEELIVDEEPKEEVKRDKLQVIRNDKISQNEEIKFEPIPEQHKITPKYKRVVSELISTNMKIEDISKAVDMPINALIRIRESEIFSSIVKKMWELDFPIESIVQVTGLKLKKVADIIINSEKLDEIEIEQGKIGEIIRNLLKMNVSIELISEASGLSIEEIGRFIDNSGVNIIVRNLLHMNIPIEIIIKGTGLSLESIDALRAY